MTRKILTGAKTRYEWCPVNADGTIWRLWEIDSAYLYVHRGFFCFV